MATQKYSPERIPGSAHDWPALLQRRLRPVVLGIAATLMTACVTSDSLPVTPIAPSTDETGEAFWREAGERALAQAIDQPRVRRRAQGIVLFVGDGMGVSTVTAARIFAGQAAGRDGEGASLSFEQFPYLSLMKTYNVNQQTPDSAGTMTAMMTGVKTDAGLISVNAATQRQDCASSQGNEIETLLEQLEARGWSTGVVSTARLTHATPAATYAHVPERGWEVDADIPVEQREQGCRDIARQLIEMDYGDGLEVALGGGRRNFLPKERDGKPFADPELPTLTGRRLDGRHLAEEWAARPNAMWVWNKAQFDAINPGAVDHLLGLFNASHMQYELDRANDPGGEPSLSEMTRKALQILMRNPKGFLLIVESGRIDHAHHATNAKRAFADTVELANAVAVADEMTSDIETLLIVTADHSHVMTMAGYASRGNPILGVVRANDWSGDPLDTPYLAGDEQPYTTIGYANGRGGRLLEEAASATGDEQIYRGPLTEQRRLDLSQIDTEADGFHQESLVPMQAETHGGEDVALYAKGPWAHLFSRTQEQSYLYYVMRHAACDDCDFNKGLRDVEPARVKPVMVVPPPRP